MSIREQQTNLTKQAIIDAATRIFDDPSAELTMQAVADLAGVSHRTVYRHFDGRDALISALGKHLDAMISSTSGSADFPESVADMVKGLAVGMRIGNDHSPLFRRALLVSIGQGMWRRDRDEAYWAMFRSEFPDLDESEAREDFAVLRHLLSAANAILIGERFGIEEDRLVCALTRNVDVVVKGIRRRDRAAAKRAR